MSIRPAVMRSSSPGFMVPVSGLAGRELHALRGLTVWSFAAPSERHQSGFPPCTHKPGTSRAQARHPRGETESLLPSLESGLLRATEMPTEMPQEDHMVGSRWLIPGSPGICPGGNQLLKIHLPGDPPARGKLMLAEGRGCIENLPASLCQPRHLTQGKETFRALWPQQPSGQERRRIAMWELGPLRARKPQTCDDPQPPF